MCKVHDKVNGQASVELYAEARLLNNVCDARYYYLRTQAMSFHAWLGTQEWCADPTQFCMNIVRSVEMALDPDGDKWCAYLFDKQAMSTSDVLADEHDTYQEEMEMIATKGIQKAYSKGEKLKDMEARLENYKVELKLHDRIQDFMDTLPQYKTPGQYKAVFKRLDALKNKGDLSYSGWITFSNQLMKMMGKKEYKPKYEVKCLPDQIKDLEGKITELNKEIMEAPEFFQDEHPEADEFIKING